MPDGGQKPAVKEAVAQELALALMGDCPLSSGAIAEGATWQKGSATLIGREAIVGAIKPTATVITIDEIVTHGKAAAVSGKMRDDSEQTRLFCHMIRFTSASACQVASIVSFEHPVGNK